MKWPYIYLFMLYLLYMSISGFVSKIVSPSKTDDIQKATTGLVSIITNSQKKHPKIAHIDDFMFFHDGFVYSLKSWHFLFAPRKILVAHSGLGPWAVRNVPASRAFKSGLTTKQTGIYWDFTNKNTGNMMRILGFFSPK